MRPSLKALHGLLPKQSYQLGETTVIGRSDACDIFLPFDGISRRHCVIARRGPRYVLMDPGSRNGTEVNGQKVQEHVLKHGDRVLIGPYELEFVHENALENRISFDEGAVIGVDLTSANAGIGALSAQSNPEHLFRALQKFQLVLKMNETISNVSEAGDLFQVLLDQLFSVLPAERGVVLLGSTAEEVRVAAVRTKEGSQDPVPISRTLVARLYKEREGLLVLNLPMDKRLQSKSLITQGVRSIVCAPLVYDGMTVGVVQLDSRQIGAFAPEDLHIVSGIARQAAVMLERSRLVDRLREDVAWRVSLERTFPREIVAALSTADARAQGVGKVGQKRRVAILCSHLRGFNDMAARVDARYLLDAINEYFVRMVDQVFHHGGTLDKFLGSGIMAFWGAPQKHEDDTARAVACALDMQSALVELNAMRAARGQMPFIMSIGVHAGEAVIGSLQSDRRFDYTVLGGTVAFAGHVMGLAQHGEVLVSQDVQRELGDAAGGEWRLPVAIKGVAQPVPLFSLRTLRTAALASEKRTVPRALTALDVTVGDGRGTMKDLSAQGAGLVITVPEGDTIAAGAAITVEFALGAERLACRATVKRINRVGTEWGNVFHLGVEWEALDGAAKAAIDAVIA